MNNLDLPTVDVSAHQRHFKVALLNTRRSATVGVLFALLPLLFFSDLFFRHLLQIDLWVLSTVMDWVLAIDPDNDSSIISWAIRFGVLGGPLVAIGVNILAILHIEYDRKLNEVMFTFKLRWLNLLIIGVCAMMFAVLFGYLAIENLGHR